MVPAATVVGLAIALFTPASIDPVQAQPQSRFVAAMPSLPSSGQADPTPAWTVFCGQWPDECAVDRAEPDAIVLTPQAWKTINDVNVQVNKAVLPVTDQDHWGVVDRWDYPDDGMGDCEDFQLLKRKLLVAAGLPRRALRMTVVIDEEGDGHAVLMARTDHGDFILDNKHDVVLPWQETGYRYIKREGSEDAQWVWLEDQLPAVVTANR